MSDSLWPHGLQPARLLCLWNSLDKNTGVGCHSFLQGIFPTQGSNLGLLHCSQVLYHLSHQGSPKICLRVAPKCHKNKRTVKSSRKIQRQQISENATKSIFPGREDLGWRAVSTCLSTKYLFVCKQSVQKQKWIEQEGKVASIQFVSVTYYKSHRKTISSGSSLSLWQ